MKKNSKVKFADKKVQKEFERLRQGNTPETELYEFLLKAYVELEEDVFCGIQIPKKQIPKDYIKKYQIDNCWKYNLPRVWRLIYSVQSNEFVILGIVLEWFDHKKYAKKFGYKKK